MSFNPSLDLEEIKDQAKSFIDQNVWDGEDRSGCKNDWVGFNPDDLQELIFDLLDNLSENRFI
jgi:hypothetical protein